MFRAQRQYFKPPRNTELHEEKQKSKTVFLICFVFVFVCFKAVSFRGQNLRKPRPDWSPWGVTRSLSHAQMVSFRGLGPNFWRASPCVPYGHMIWVHMKKKVPGILYFQGQKLSCLRTFLEERGIQTSSEGKGVNNNWGSRPTQLLSTSCDTHWSLSLARTSKSFRDLLLL